MSIALKSQGAGAGTETNGAALNLVCPATVDVKDILAAHVMHTGTTTAPTTPSGWTLLYGPANVGTTATARHWVFGKIADGTEDGATVNFGTDGGTNGRAGRIYSFSGYVCGTIELVIPVASFSDIPHATDPQGPTVTTTMNGALAVAFTCQDDNNTEEAIAGASGGTWGSFQTFVDASLGPQGLHLDIQVSTPTANPGTISGGAMVAANDEAGTIGFEIRPVGIPTLAQFGDSHTVIDASPSGWGQFFENLGSVIKFNGQYFMYYVAGDADVDPGDDYVLNRKLGVATSPDGVNWTPYASNPIIEFEPQGGSQDEEGVGGCVAVVHDGQVHLYYAGMRWISGGSVDAEIRYRVSDDGFTFTGDTLILAQENDEFYPCAAYVDSSDVFHVYYVGPLTDGGGDLKRLSGSTPNAITTNGTVTTTDFSSLGGIIDLSADQLLLFNDLAPLNGVVSSYLIAKSSLGTLGALARVIDPNSGGAILDFATQFFKDGDQWFMFSTRSTADTPPFSNTQIVCRTYPDIPAFQLSPSANIAANAATDTTAILTAPASKDSGDFQAGKISDDRNPLPSINLASDLYTEVEFCHKPTVYAELGATYEFRITDNGTPLDTYTEYAEIIIEAGALSAEVGQLVETDTVQAVGRTKIKAVGLLTESDALQTVLTGKARTLGLLSEVSAAHSLTRQKVKALTLVTETDTMSAVVRMKSRAIGLLSETGTLFSADQAMARAAGQVATTDALLPVGRVKIRAVGLLTDTEEMLSVSSGGGTPIELLTESNLMQPVTAQKIKGVSLTTEADAMQAVTARKARPVGLTEETGQVFAVARRKVRTIGIITETDAVLGVQVPTFIEQLIETDTMLPVRAIKTRIVGILTDSVSMFAVGRTKTRSSGILLETDQLFTVAGIGGSVYGNVLHLTDQQLRMPGVQYERLTLPRLESQALAVPTVTNESLIES